MSLLEILGWFALGCLIGFVLGYQTRSIREITTEIHEMKEEVDEIDEYVQEQKHEGDVPQKEDGPRHRTRLRDNEKGFVRNPIVMDIALLIVVILTVWAAFASQSASNDVEKTQSQLTRVTLCNQHFLSRALSALSERSDFVQRQAGANVALQKAQGKFLSTLLREPPPSDEERSISLHKYVDALTEFYKANAQTAAKAERSPYPTDEELADCLAGGKT
jgi:hypothetical protein